MELIIGASVGVIGLCYLVELFIAPINWGQATTRLVTPSLPDNAALFIAVGIVGATVMPHAIYLHSGLTQSRAQMRNNQDRRKILTFSNREVVFALFAAFRDARTSWVNSVSGRCYAHSVSSERLSFCR